MQPLPRLTTQISEKAQIWWAAASRAPLITTHTAPLTRCAPQSSDEEFQDLPSEEEYEDYDDEAFIVDDDPPAPRLAPPIPQQPARNAGGGLNDLFGGLANRMNPGAFQAGFGGHAFARAPANAFRRQYKAYSTAILEVQEGRSWGGGRANLMYGGKSACAVEL